MSVDALHALVSSAIWRAEQFDELGLEAASTWIEVSRLEEALANVISARESEGRIARRGAVRAALKAKDPVRAQSLVERYTSEKGFPKSLGASFRRMLNADARELFEEFPCAAKHHKATDVLRLANRLQEHGPFWLAA